jgi:hypothetical protein
VSRTQRREERREDALSELLGLAGTRMTEVVSDVRSIASVDQVVAKGDPDSPDTRAFLIRSAKDLATEVANVARAYRDLELLVARSGDSDLRGFATDFFGSYANAAALASKPLPGDPINVDSLAKIERLAEDLEETVDRIRARCLALLHR